MHDIHYLPPINASPRNHVTVQEILTQAKATAETLGLICTDLVLDHAIYSKALEVLKNPNNTDLKEFVNFRMVVYMHADFFWQLLVKDLCLQVSVT